MSNIEALNIIIDELKGIHKLLEPVDPIKIITPPKEKQKLVNKNCCIPEWMANEVKRRHVNCSAVLQKALTEVLSTALKPTSKPLEATHA